MLRRCLQAVVFAVLMGSGMAQAQAIPPADLRAAENEIRQQQSAQAEAYAARRAEQRRTGGTQGRPGISVDPLVPSPGGPCFEIRNIILSGFEAFKRAPEGYRDLIGSCATAADIAGVSLGADIKIRTRATLTLKVAHALSRPDESPPNAQPAFEAGRTVGYIGFKVEF